MGKQRAKNSQDRSEKEDQGSFLCKDEPLLENHDNKDNSLGQTKGENKDNNQAKNNLMHI